MKNFFKKLWEKIKAWYSKTALPWLKKSWMQIVNILVVAIVYGNTDSLPGVQTIAGLWLFVLLAYYIFWKLFGAEKIFKKMEEDIKVNESPLNLLNTTHEVVKNEPFVIDSHFVDKKTTKKRKI